MPDFVYLNDKVVPVSEAKVSVFDHGFLYGDGLFETMRAAGTKVHLVEEHLDRLYHSAEIMRIDIPWTRPELKKALSEVLEANALENAAVRLTVSRGEGLPIPDPTTCKKPTLVITCRPAPDLKGEVYEGGVLVSILETRRNYDKAFPVAVKSCNFLNNIFARQELKGKGAYEGLMLNYEGFLTEGTVNNVFFVKNGRMFTPSLKCGILDGIIRAQAIKKARVEGIEVVEGFFKPEDILEADEVFLTNSVSLVVPVRKIGERDLPSVPGVVTQNQLKNLAGSLST